MRIVLQVLSRKIVANPRICMQKRGLNSVEYRLIRVEYRLRTKHKIQIQTVEEEIEGGVGDQSGWNTK